MLKKLTVLLSVLAMMMFMVVPPAIAHHSIDHHFNNGHKIDDGLDHDLGGGNDHIKQNHGGGND